jgi:FMN phosphatase YigB (HAD superfamily)
MNRKSRKEWQPSAKMTIPCHLQWVPETINLLKQKGYILGIITDTAMPFARKLKGSTNTGLGKYGTW